MKVNGENKSTQLRTFGTVTLTPMDEFFVKALVSRTSYNQTRGYAETKKHISTVRNGKNGFASRGTTASIDNLLEITAQYKNNFGAHNLTGLCGLFLSQTIPMKIIGCKTGFSIRSI